MIGHRDGREKYYAAPLVAVPEPTTLALLGLGLAGLGFSRHRKRRIGRSAARRRDVALDALREAIGEHGEPMPGIATIPKGVKAVTLEQWRSRWALRIGYEDSTGNSIAGNFHKDNDALLKAAKVAISKLFAWVNE